MNFKNSGIYSDEGLQSETLGFLKFIHYGEKFILLVKLVKKSETKGHSQYIIKTSIEEKHHNSRGNK